MSLYDRMPQDDADDGREERDLRSYPPPGPDCDDAGPCVYHAHGGNPREACSGSEP